VSEETITVGVCPACGQASPCQVVPIFGGDTRVLCDTCIREKYAPELLEGIITEEDAVKDLSAIIAERRTILKVLIQNLAGSGERSPVEIAAATAVLVQRTEVRIVDRGTFNDHASVAVRAQVEKPVPATVEINQTKLHKLALSEAALGRAIPGVQISEALRLEVTRTDGSKAPAAARKPYAEVSGGATREERAAKIADEKIKWDLVHGWTVEGSNGNRYNVSLDPLSCSCPDFQARGQPCKHCLAVQKKVAA